MEVAEVVVSRAQKPQVVSQKWAPEHVGQNTSRQSSWSIIGHESIQSSYLKHVVSVLLSLEVETLVEDSEVVVSEVKDSEVKDSEVSVAEDSVDVVMVLVPVWVRVFVVVDFDMLDTLVVEAVVLELLDSVLVVQ